MATSRLARVEDVRADLPARATGQRLLITEIGGSSPMRLELQGSFGLEVGSEWQSELRGETRVPLGASNGYSSVLGRSWGETEMTLALDAQFLRRHDIKNTVSLIELGYRDNTLPYDGEHRTFYRRFIFKFSSKSFG
jgi:hypothetical protein